MVCMGPWDNIGNWHQYRLQLHQEHKPDITIISSLGPDVIGEPLHQTWKWDPTPHHSYGRAGSALHLRAVVSGALTDQYSYHPKRSLGLWVDPPQHLLCPLLEQVKGLFLHIRSRRISITGVNGRISMSGIGDLPVLTVYQKPKALNLTHISWKQSTLMKKGIVYHVQQLPMPLRRMKKRWRQEKSRSGEVFSCFSDSFVVFFVFMFWGIVF